MKYLRMVSENRPGLECDGMTQVVTYVLKKNLIPHNVKCGVLMRDNERVVAPHFWVELEDGRIIDFRATMWAGRHPHVPNGIFQPKEYPRITHHGERIRMNPSAFIFNILTGESKLPDEIDGAKEAAHRPL